MNQRSIPFGYQMSHGELIINPSEAATVQEIFSKYCAGNSLKAIAQFLTERGIEFMANKANWDKSRIKRILEDRRYLGETGYPCIVSYERFTCAQQKKSASATNTIELDEEIKVLKSCTVCHHCSTSLKRRKDSRFSNPVFYRCPQCGFKINLSDKSIKEKVCLLQKSIASSPSLVKIISETTELYSIEAKRLTNEVHRQLDSGSFSEEELINMVLRCAAENYNAIAGVQHITDRLTAVFAHAGPPSSFNTQLFTQTVKYIRLTSSGEVLLQLQNGKIIGEDDVR